MFICSVSVIHWWPAIIVSELSRSTVVCIVCTLLAEGVQRAVLRIFSCGPHKQDIYWVNSANKAFKSSILFLRVKVGCRLLHHLQPSQHALLSGLPAYRFLEFSLLKSPWVWMGLNELLLVGLMWKKQLWATSMITQVVTQSSGFPPVDLPLFLYLFALLGASFHVVSCPWKGHQARKWKNVLGGSSFSVLLHKATAQLIAWLYLCQNVVTETSS